MPTYAFSTAKELTAEQHKIFVSNVTSIHQVEATCPHYFVQVIFYQVEAGSNLLGGEPAPSDHVWVRADIRVGRRTNKRRRSSTHHAESSEILGIAEQSVWVYISDIPAQGVLEFGNVLPEPGGEEQWLSSLPSTLRKKLMRSADGPRP